LVQCAVQVLAPAAGDSGLARLVVALTEVDGRTEDSVAELVGRTEAEVAELRSSSRSGIGAAPRVNSDCRGWALAARRDRLTVSEQEAAHGHLSLCRSCRVRLDEQRRTRDKLRLSGSAVSAVVVADVVALSVPTGGAVAGASGLASLVLGKAGVAVVGGAAVAIAATSAGVAVARQAPAHNDKPAGVVHHINTHVTGPSGVTAVPHTAGPPTVGATAPAGHETAAAVPSSAPTTRLAPLPTVSPMGAPSSLPTVPTTLPTNLTSLPPLPTGSVSPTLPVTLPTDVIATATSLLGH
jgi:hypothetical protein